ncbi:MAG: Gfo/Idh/MocA family protein [Fluviicola sp.]
MSRDKLKIGLLGVGHLGKIHLKLLLELSDKFEVVGFYDPDMQTSKLVETNFSVNYFNSIDELIDSVDCISIVSPTPTHFDLAKKAITKGKHVFIEKPFTETSEQARELIELALDYNVKIQIGHVERFNPAFVGAKNLITKPLFFEIHRLAIYNKRGTDVSVILDLMIHDIDLILHLVKSELVDIQATGVNIISSSPDMASVRLLFENGCVANITSSRVSMQNMRKIRVFQENSYITMDLMNHTVDKIILAKTEFSNEKLIQINDELYFGIKKPRIIKTNAIQEEMKNFYGAIRFDEEIQVTSEDAFHSIEIAEQIIEKMNQTILVPVNLNQ